jgi:hypothetical protein
VLVAEECSPERGEKYLFSYPRGGLKTSLGQRNNFSSVAKNLRKSILCTKETSLPIPHFSSLVALNLQQRWRRDTGALAYMLICTGAALSLLLWLICFPFSILYRVVSIHESIYALHADLKFAWTPITHSHILPPLNHLYRILCFHCTGKKYKKTFICEHSNTSMLPLEGVLHYF